MTDSFDTPMHSDLPTREDVLIGRVVDGEANDADWLDLERIARGDGEVWKRVAHAQRAHARLERAVEDAIAVAELVDAPIYRPGKAFWGSMRSSLGWAVAAVLAIAFVGKFPQFMPGSGGPVTAAGFSGVPLNTASPDQAYNRYIQAGLADGRIVGEMEPMLVDARQVPGATSGSSMHEVIVLRRVLERISGENLPVYMLHTNEHGQSIPQPMELPAAQAPMRGVGL